MPDIYFDVDAAISECPVNILPLTDDTDFKTIEDAIVYNAAGMDLVWNFVTSAGAFTQTAVTPTTAGDYDWTNQGNGLYTLEITASGGASINNDTEGYGWFTGFITGVLPFRGPTIGFRASGINDLMMDSAYSATLGLAGTNLDTTVSSRLAPTVAARTIDIAATGEAGIDLDNVKGTLTQANVGWVDANSRVDVGKWLGTAVTTSASTAKPEMDAFSISDDATAADNLEAMHDGTGYIDDTAPASRSQVDSIGAASGGAINYEAIGDNTLGALKGVTFVGTESSGTFADTDADDGVYHQITHTTNAIDIVYSYFVGANRTATEIVWLGYLTSSNDTITIQAYDFVAAGWDTRKIITGTNGTTNETDTIKLLAKHTGTSGADIGTAYIRFVNTGMTSPVLNTDELLLAAVNTSTSRGFLDNSVWVDTVNGISGTGEGVGTASTPSDNITDARTIADANNLNTFKVISGSNLGALGQEFDGYQFINDGTGAIVALDGQSVNSTYFKRMRIQGNDDGANTQRTFYDNCRLDGNTLGDYFATNCAFGGDIVFAQASNSYTEDYPRQVSTAAVVRDFALLTSVDWIANGVNCDIEIKQLAATSTATIMGTGGNITINANCTGGTLTIYGNFTITDNASGAVGVVDGGRIDTGQINAQCDISIADYDGPTNAEMVARTLVAADYFDPTADTVDVGAINGSTLAAVRLALSAGTIVIGAAITGTLSTTQMTTDLTEITDDHWNGRIIIWTGGVLKDQATDITGYNGTTKLLTYTATTEAPSNTDPFIIV